MASLAAPASAQQPKPSFFGFVRTLRAQLLNLLCPSLLVPPPLVPSATAFRLANAMVMGLIVAAMYYQQGIGSGLNLYGLFLNTVMFLSFANSKSACMQQQYLQHQCNAYCSV